MLSIRLQRVGRKHEPVFRLVLTDSKNSTKSGRFLEVLGSYDSRKSESAVINTDKVLHWISKGAQASDTVHNLLVTRGIVKGDKKDVLSKKPKAKEEPKPEEPVVVEAPQAEVAAPAEETKEDTKVEEVSQPEVESEPSA